MSTATLNKKAPAFNLPATGDQTLTQAQFKGRKLVLFFYPRDATPGCTKESQDFRDFSEDFEAANTAILGISQDSIAKHEKFKTKQSMPFELLSDEAGDLCNAYDVIKLKNMYGKKFNGIERSTFLIDENGLLRQEWRKVKVPGHVAEVLAAAQAL